MFRHSWKFTPKYSRHVPERLKLKHTEKGIWDPTSKSSFTAKHTLGLFFKNLASKPRKYLKGIVVLKFYQFSDEAHTPEKPCSWVYRESRFTSLAEACDRILETARQFAGHDRVQLVLEKSQFKFDQQSDMAFVSVTSVDPCPVLPHFDFHLNNFSCILNCF